MSARPGNGERSLRRVAWLFVAIAVPGSLVACSNARPSASSFVDAAVRRTLAASSFRVETTIWSGQLSHVTEYRAPDQFRFFVDNTKVPLVTEDIFEIGKVMNTTVVGFGGQYDTFPLDPPAGRGRKEYNMLAALDSLSWTRAAVGYRSQGSDGTTVVVTIQDGLLATITSTTADQAVTTTRVESYGKVAPFSPPAPCAATTPPSQPCSAIGPASPLPSSTPSSIDLRLGPADTGRRIPVAPGTVIAVQADDINGHLVAAHSTDETVVERYWNATSGRPPSGTTNYFKAMQPGTAMLDTVAPSTCAITTATPWGCPTLKLGWAVTIVVT